MQDEVAGEGNYWVVRQGVEEVRRPNGAPAVSMGAYLVETGQEELFREISIYGERGETREEVRRLYMNAVAMRVLAGYGAGAGGGGSPAPAAADGLAGVWGAVQRIIRWARAGAVTPARGATCAW